MNVKERSYKKELLDRDDIPFDDIVANMKELNFINTWLGGHQISIKGLQQLIGETQALTICEIGCGGGDNLVALNKWCLQKNISASFIGIDLKEPCIALGKTQTSLLQNTTWMVNDYRNVVFQNQPDIIFSSLFCHHFTNGQLKDQLQWMKQNSRMGFFINDLERNAVAYYLIKVLTFLFSSSYLVKNDAPLSVARGFKKREWFRLLQSANLPHCPVNWKWAFRHLVICKHGTK
ncbi:MAG: methyltransferase domain-containing protein [Chitinophagaceae bacterium]|nr:methyltransferase domain-containing protein [Chitinophagaceae bacterium]